MNRFEPRDGHGRLRQRRETGRAGEMAACAFLIGKGYRILEQNWRCRMGEIDLIAEHDGDLVFVEVRTRTSGYYGSAEESVDVRKQRRLRRIAQAYVASVNRHDSRLRFDVVAVTRSKGTNEYKLRHIVSAF